MKNEIFACSKDRLSSRSDAAKQITGRVKSCRNADENNIYYRKVLYSVDAQRDFTMTESDVRSFVRFITAR